MWWSHYGVSLDIIPDAVKEFLSMNQWRTISVVPVSKLPKKMKPIDKLKKIGDEVLIWVRVELGRDDEKKLLVARDTVCSIGYVSSGTAGLVFIRDGLSIATMSFSDEIRYALLGGSEVTLTWDEGNTIVTTSGLE